MFKDFLIFYNYKLVPKCPGGGMVDTGDLKSPGHCDRAGSSPAPGTTISFVWSHRQAVRPQPAKLLSPVQIRVAPPYKRNIYKLGFIYL